jgi:hypothetical protein
MNKQKQILLLVLSMCLLGGAINLIINNIPHILRPTSCSKDITNGCSVFTISKGDQVFFGGNDDYINPDSYYWVDPGNNKKYGAIWIGTPDNVQQGVNEKGLAYDANGLPRVDVNPHLERKPALGGYSYYPIQILHECATVEEVIEWANTHRWHAYMHDQMHFADASGDAVIISAGVDGELVFTRKPPGDSFLVSTNFNVANPSNGNYPCNRYETATQRLSELEKQDKELSEEDAAAVLQAVSTSGGSSWTLESLVADLPHGLIYLYYFRQFDKPVVLNVAEEIANPRPQGPFSKLFPDEVQQEATFRYQQALSRQGICSIISKVWIGLLFVSLILVIFFSRQKPKVLAYWLPVTIILGPIGLLVWSIIRWKKGTHLWQTTLVEAAGHLPPIAIAMMAMLSMFVLVPQTQSNQQLQLMFIFVVPLMIGWLFYQGPLLALTSQHGYLQTLGMRFPAVWVVSNLGMTGTILLILRLVNWISSNCSLMPPSLWTLISFWVAVVASVCLGMLIILFYEGWAVYHGYRAWSVLAFGTGEVTTPPWCKIWWWILLSIAILIGVIIVGS